VNCPSCGSPNETGRKFCGECGTRLAAVCASCGTANPPAARFCGECGGSLAGSGAPIAARPATAPATLPSAAPVAERRRVSVLFADLVGFTTLSEGRDPETVRELLSRYFELATETIGRYGGTVEKFIGDAVMALWGAPTAHEDDAERAVRAAMELLNAVATLGPGVQARCGVLTGEAAVTLGAKDQGMVAGDLVNTASRLQSVAPPGTVLVGEETRLASSGAIAYEEAGEQVLKGKVAPVTAWRALRVIAERGGRGRDDRLEAPFVGRDSELRLLKDLFHATSRERRVRLVSITGQAGIGKSRLAWEFLKYVDGVVERVWWHEGRSPSYGEGITFWALGEMVRSRAGLLESDDPATTRVRIGEMLAEHVPDEAERRRIEPALLALLGVGDPPPGGAPELFLAWRTFFERLAATGVVALLFEDLHWADSGTLDFVEHMLEWSRNVPILIITLARPELLDRRPGWGAGKRSFLALDLQALDEPSMRALLGGLVPGLPETAVRSIVARAEGIPLYAVETIRMLVAEGRLVPAATGGYEPVGELGELAVPGTLHALIAARLDALDPLERALLQDAAVLGQSFTADALASIAGASVSEIEGRLDRLVRGDLLHVEVDPRSPERGQYAFVQALIREVAYSTLAMRDRRSRHLAAARFFESLGDDEIAGALAAHYLAAYKASAEGPEAVAVAGQARIALTAAADRARTLGALGQVVTFLEQAVDVATDPDDRATLFEQAGIASLATARPVAGLTAFESALTIRRELGDRSGQARLHGWVGAALGNARRREEAYSGLVAALAEFEDLGDDDPDLVFLMRQLAGLGALLGDYDVTSRVVDRVLASSERLGLIELAAEALHIKGTVALRLGRTWEGRALVQGGLQLFEEAGLLDGVLRANLFLATITALDSPAQTLAFEKEAIALARRTGNRATEILTVNNSSEDARRTGDWAWAEGEINGLLEIDVDDSVRMQLEMAKAFFDQAHGRLRPGGIDEFRRFLEDVDDTELESGVLDLEAFEALIGGNAAEAVRLFQAAADVSDFNAPYLLPKVGRAAIIARDPDRARAALDRLASLATRGRTTDVDRGVIRAGLRALDHDEAGAMAGYRLAMTGFRDLGQRWDEALLGLEVAFILGVDDPERSAWADRTREIFNSLEAVPYLALLDRAVSGRPEGTASDLAGTPGSPEPAST
jgi:class 3 adenylate cyclase/tetratricopeptide (TPR) repeat protein